MRKPRGDSTHHPFFSWGSGSLGRTPPQRLWSPPPCPPVLTEKRGVAGESGLLVDVLNTWCIIYPFIPYLRTNFVPYRPKSPESAHVWCKSDTIVDPRPCGCGDTRTMRKHAPPSPPHTHRTDQLTPTYAYVGSGRVDRFVTVLSAIRRLSWR